MLVLSRAECRKGRRFILYKNKNSRPANQHSLSLSLSPEPQTLHFARAVLFWEG